MIAYLIAALLMLCPSMSKSVAESHVQAAIDAGRTAGVDPIILLSIAKVESDFNPHSLSRLECRGARCARKTGVWSAPVKPPGARPSYYCGVLQVGGDVSWGVCRLYMEDIRVNYLAGALHLQDWAKMSGARAPRCKGASLQTERGLNCALRGYNGGFWEVGLTDHIYPRMVLRTAWQFRRAVRRAEWLQMRKNS